MAISRTGIGVLCRNSARPQQEDEMVDIKPTNAPALLYYHAVLDASSALTLSSPEVSPPVGSYGGFPQSSHGSPAGGARESRSILYYTPFGVISDWANGKKATPCDFFRGFCSLFGIDNSSGDAQVPSGPANNRPNPPGHDAVVGGYDRGVHGGAFIELSLDPQVQARVMRLLGEAYEDARKACDVHRHPESWDANTRASMQQLFGSKAGSSEVQAKLERLRDGIKRHIENNGGDIYLELSRNRHSDIVAYAPMDSTGRYTGQIVLNADKLYGDDRGYLDNDGNLKKTLVHEVAHSDVGMHDHFYMRYDKNRGYVVKPDENGRSVPFNEDDAPDTPDPYAYGIQVLAGDKALDDAGDDTARYRYET